MFIRVQGFFLTHSQIIFENTHGCFYPKFAGSFGLPVTKTGGELSWRSQHHCPYRLHHIHHNNSLMSLMNN